LHYKNYIVYLLLLLGFNCVGQQLSFKHLTTADGLLSDLRLTMAEDRLGRLWIGSDEGVNVFDGFELSSFSQPDKSGLTGNNIQNIFCDKAGTIWIKSLTDVQYKRENETRFNSLISSEKDLNNTRFFGQASHGALLCVTRNNVYAVAQNLAISKLSGLSALFKKYNSNPLTFDHFKNDEWFIGFGKKLVLVNVAEQRVINEFDYRSAWTVCRINDSTVIAGSFVKDTVSIIHVNSGLIEPINNWTTSDGMPIAGYTGTIAYLGNNKYALACRLYGVYILDLEKRFAHHYLHEDANPASIQASFCRRLFVSSGGTMFVHSKGISYTQIDTPGIKTVKYLVTDKGERYDAGFTNFVEDNKGMMWISTNTGLLMWDRKKGSNKMFPFFNPAEGRQKFKTVRAVVTDKLNRVWAFSFSAGFGMLKPDGSFEQYRKYSDSPYMARSLEVMAVTKDSKDNFILCTNGGFFYFDPIEKTSSHFINNKKLKNIATNTTINLLVDGRNNWWIAQEDGLYFYDRSLDSLYTIAIPGFKKGDIAFYALAQDTEGNIYAGTTRGLYQIKKGSFSPKMILSKRDGLPSDNIMGLFFDRSESLWIVGNLGLARYNDKTHVLENFDDRDGAEISNHSFMNYYVAPDGEIFIGSNVGGFNHFYPDKLTKNKVPLKVYITSVSLPDSVINISGGSAFTFRYNQNNLSFSFITVDFSIARFIQYRYKLAGFDTAYIYAGKQRVARYTNLAAGSYTFFVEASSNSSDWYPASNPVTLKIKPVFWNTWWFRLLALLFIGSLIYTAYRYRIAQVNKEAQLKADYEIKLNELEISALRTQMNPHFIFNSLNTINSFINSNDRTQANQYISKFSRLIRLILDHSRQKKIALADELSVVELYIQMEQIRFENKFSFQLINNSTLDMDSIEIPPLIIQPFIENAILHGLLPSDKPGFLSVTIVKENNKIICSIEDNGIGREKARLNKKQDGVKRESHGMEITLKRIELFNKENNITDKVEIIDLQEPTGTKIIIPLALLETY